MLCLVVCLTLLGSFFHFSLKHVHDHYSLRFIFISAKDKLVPLPRGQLLPPSDWTMQLMVTDITDGDDGEPMYMTRYRTGLKLGNENGSLTERRSVICVGRIIVLLRHDTKHHVVPKSMQLQTVLF